MTRTLVAFLTAKKCLLGNARQPESQPNQSNSTDPWRTSLNSCQSSQADRDLRSIQDHTTPELSVQKKRAVTSSRSRCDRVSLMGTRYELSIDCRLLPIDYQSIAGCCRGSPLVALGENPSNPTFGLSVPWPVLIKRTRQNELLLRHRRHGENRSTKTTHVWPRRPT